MNVLKCLRGIFGIVAPAPCVSILIPVYNRCELTRACLESVFAFADPSLSTEIIVIDNCSSDGTADYLRSLGDRIRVIHNTTRKNYGRNMNEAAEAARG